MIVDLHPTEDQQLIADSISALLADRLPVSRLREAVSQAGAAERAILRDLADLGIFGLGLDEADGGTGYGLPEQVIVARALGRVLASPTLLAQMVAPALADGGDRAALIAGERRAAFATVGSDGQAYLFDGDAVDTVVLLGGGVALLPFEAFAWARCTAIDATLSAHRAVPPALAPRDAAADRISLLIAAALAGAAQAATALAIDYAVTREQFGQPIASFQAIKHALADMRVRADAAEAQTAVAAVTFGRGDDDRREVAAARWLAGDAAIANARVGIQVHGGMGFTAECDAHLFLKRAHVLAALGSSRRGEEVRLLSDA